MGRDKMFDLVREPCDTVVEIGALAGAWSKRCLEALPQSHLWCVDPWAEMACELLDEKDPDRTFALWFRNVSFALDRVHAVRLTSEKAAKLFDWPIDFLFIDGHHSDVERDLRWWWPKLRKGGLLVGHDIKMKVVKRGVENFFGKDYKVGELYETDKNRDKLCFWKYKE